MRPRTPHHPPPPPPLRTQRDVLFQLRCPPEHRRVALPLSPLLCCSLSVTWLKLFEWSAYVWHVFCFTPSTALPPVNPAVLKTFKKFHFNMVTSKLRGSIPAAFYSLVANKPKWTKTRSELVNKANCCCAWNYTHTSATLTSLLRAYLTRVHHRAACPSVSCTEGSLKPWWPSDCCMLTTGRPASEKWCNGSRLQLQIVIN